MYELRKSTFDHQISEQTTLKGDRIDEKKETEERKKYIKDLMNNVFE